MATPEIPKAYTVGITSPQYFSSRFQKIRKTRTSKVTEEIVYYRADAETAWHCWQADAWPSATRDLCNGQRVNRANSNVLKSCSDFTWPSSVDSSCATQLKTNSTEAQAQPPCHETSCGCQSKASPLHHAITRANAARLVE